MVSQVASYPLTLLELMDEDDGFTARPLGIAERIGSESSAFDVPAHRLLNALITHEPSPGKDNIVKEFLFELGKCGNVLVKRLGGLLR